MSGGPLAGLRVIEMAGIGPGPFAGMLLADLGADVIRVDRPSSGAGDERARRDVVNRGKRSVIADLKTQAGVDLVLRLVESSDALIEGMRPGVMERLGLGPDVCRERNPRLVYGRMTGWGQSGPLAHVAGHDINYIALTGALWAMGRPGEPPSPPLNLVGDYGGGAMFLVVGVLAALLERASSGEGQVVDAAMVDGTAAITALFSALRATGSWTDQRGANVLDGGAPYYDVYECADGRYLSVGAIEPQFYAELVRRSGFRSDETEAERLRQPAREEWPQYRADWAALFRTRTQAEWTALLSEHDTCVQPVLDWDEATDHPHLRARATFIERDGIVQPAPAPRFSRTPPGVVRRPPVPGEHAGEVAGV
ncbi:MAG TPA: CaiB/BaiF CoA-transferase family protein [Candidatus Dormibacteraeota bacterium]|nr:CaiB/BaiF CoA-transferase family protein [Candidatus Dormibacteraeota bacterium]